MLQKSRSHLKIPAARQRGDIKHVPPWRPTNTKRHAIKSCHPGFMHPFYRLWLILSPRQVKKSKVAGHEGPKVWVRYSPTLSLTSALDGDGWSTPRPGLFTPGKDSVPILKEAGWAPEPVWTGAENLASTGIRSPDRPARSVSLYGLSYPGPPSTSGTDS